ncbi:MULTISPECIES: hypothetical protein [Citricoccus]|uniref:hypothetical protein n=1 Tax=Citricoccus TaxID=169133 RepID=UPI000255F232|nr:hypothetical protein [Citricoccus sp. CH26A]
MDFLHSASLFLHILGAAALLGGWLAMFRRPTVSSWQHLGAWVQLVTGVLLVGLLEMNDDAGPVNHAKIAVKLVVLLAVLVAAVMGRRRVRRGQDVPTGMAHAVGGLTLVNIAIAVFW